jgi:hypothetical protein
VKHQLQVLVKCVRRFRRFFSFRFLASCFLKSSLAAAAVIVLAMMELLKSYTRCGSGQRAVRVHAASSGGFVRVIL